MKYIIMCDASPADLAMRVTDALNCGEGWELSGGISSATIEGRVLLIQALVRQDTKNDALHAAR
jgi:hypothetical protein